MSNKTGIGAILAAIVPSVIAGLNKRNRDEKTPRKGGVIRDVGVTVMGATGASSLMVDCTVYGLSDPYCHLVHGLALVLGFVMYFIGAGKKVEEPTETTKTENP